jgi:hypothetical protein
MKRRKRKLLDQVLIQMRISSDDLRGADLEELAQLLIAFLQIVVVTLQVVAEIVLGFARFVRRLRALPAWPAAWLLGRVTWRVGVG